MRSFQNILNWIFTFLEKVMVRPRAIFILFLILSLSLSCIAGHYVPAFARAVLASNSIYSENLKGIGKSCHIKWHFYFKTFPAIGNGWTDPLAQYPEFSKVIINSHDNVYFNIYFISMLFTWTLLMKLLLLLLTKCFQLAKVKLIHFNCYYLIIIFFDCVFLLDFSCSIDSQ